MTMETQAAFAKRMKDHVGRHVSRAAVKQWADKGNIVMTDGLVDVEASLEQMAETTGARPDVAARHAREAVEKATSRGAAPQSIEPDLKIDQARRVRAIAEARIKAADAEIRELERDRERGNLIEKSVVDFVLDDFGASVRTAMENFAGLVAPNVFGLTTMDEIYAVIDESAERVLDELAEAMKRYRERKQE